MRHIPTSHSDLLLIKRTLVVEDQYNSDEIDACKDRCTAPNGSLVIQDINILDIVVIYQTDFLVADTVTVPSDFVDCLTIADHR